MMPNITSLGDRLTPSRPVEIAFGPETGLPDDAQSLVIIGHRGSGAASGASGVDNYASVTISNVADVTACSGEVAADFGDGSELAKMVLAAVRANEAAGVHPAIKAIPLAYADTDFGAADAALVAAKRIQGKNYVVSPYAGDSSTLRGKLFTAAEVMSGPDRTDNNQFGSFGVAHIRAVTDPANLPSPDTYHGILTWLPDTGTGGDAPAYSVGEIASVAAAKMAANGRPYNPLDSVVLTGVAAPAKDTDWITVGVGLESEVALQAGVTPLCVKPTEEVAFVRTITTRITFNGVRVTAYYDVQDFNVLFDWRKTIWTRENQSDFTNVKASQEKAKDLRGEMVRLAGVFQDLGMFQAVDQLAKYFRVQRRSSDRSTFEVLTPVNVIPGLHNILNRIEAGVQFDTFVV
jgi:phage tail sheath gpL-like